jgi:hypothetical protein
MNRLNVSFPNLTIRLWVAILALFLSPDMTSKRITRKTGRHRYTVMHVYDTNDGPCSESFHVLAYDPQEASYRRADNNVMRGIDPFETHVFRGWNVRELTV